LSGYQYIHHLFDSAISTIKYLNKPIESKVSEDHGVLVSHEGRLAVLEQHFASFRAEKDLEYAIQQEINDWNENEANRSFFVLSGLPLPPGKMSGGMLMFLLMYIMPYYFGAS
jgi:hypothetical protein